MTNYIQVDPATDLRIEKEREDYFYASFNRQPELVLGCPLGRGSTPDAAIADLKRRVEIESPVEIHFLKEV